MTARACAVLDRGIDYSGARPAPSASFQAGGRFALRYSAGVGNSNKDTQWKLCGLHEIHDIIAGGMDFIANSEWYENRITAGSAAGLADGRADLAFWKARGYAKGAAIYVSWDTDPVRSLWPAADAYLRAYRSGLGGYYQLGAYAGTQYLRHALAAKIIAYGWRPNAGSWSNDGLPYQPSTTTLAQRQLLVASALAKTPAAIWQTGNYWWSKGADECLILRPCGSHLQTLAKVPAKPAVPAHPKPTPKPAPAPAPHYPVPAGNAKAMVSGDRAWAFIPTNDGRIEVRHNGAHHSYIQGA